MKLLRIFTILSFILSVNVFAVTISGTVSCDINDNGTIDAGEVCPSEGIWVKLYNVSRDRWISQEPLYPSGDYAFEISATGDFRIFIDNNGDTTKDSTPTPPINMLFSAPSDGTLSISISDQNSTGNDFVLIPDPVCDCSGGDGMMTIAPIVIDGNMNDWGTVLLDPDNGVCDSATSTDYDINKSNTGEIQSTGRNLTHFVWTGQEDENGFVYGYTERAGSNTNTETFIFYKDGDADGLMEDGDIALVASWQGNTGTVKMEICDYVVDIEDGNASSDFMVWQEGDVGTDLLYPTGATVPSEWVGKADGYTLHGGLTNCRTEDGLIGAGSADGLRMEWQVPWKIVNMLPFQPITYHVSTMNASVNQTNPPGQVDDNMGSCPLPAPVVLLDINKTADNTMPRIGEDVTYTITVTNSGDPTTSVVVNDTLPSGMTYESYSGTTDWTCTNTGQDVNCSYTGLLTNGGSTSVQIIASVEDNTSLWGQTLTNNVCTSSDENATLVCDDENITVYRPVVTFDINKTVSDPTPLEGTGIFYTIEITNNGPDIANNLVMRDVLPSGVDFDFVYSSDNWLCTETNNVVDCNLSDQLLVGDTTNIVITVDVNGTEPNEYNNTACVNSDENTTDICDSALISPVAPPIVPVVLNISKGVDPDTPLIGETIVYGIIVTNVGLDTAINVEVNDTLPTGLTYNDEWNATVGTYDGTTWSVGDLAPGAKATLLITAVVNTDVNIGDTVTNTACTNAENNITVVCVDTNFTVRAPNVTLAIDKTVDDVNPWAEDNVTYTIVVTNNGTDTAHNVVVDDPLPAGVTYVSSSPINAFNTSTEEWIVGILEPGASRELNITVSIDIATEGNLISNVAAVTADEYPTPVSDDANLTVYTPIVELTIQKVADQNFPPEGADITYTIIVNNIGEDNATGVTVSDTLPSGVIYVSAGGNGWSCIYNDITVECDYEFEIAPGLPTSFDINVTVDTGTAGTTLTNTACTESDENTTTVCTDNNITVNQYLDLVVTKDVNNSTPAEGETIGYTITVTNNGPITATGVEVTENIIELGGLTNISADPSHGSFDDNETWSVGTLNALDTATLLISATVAEGASGTYTNFAALTGLDQNDTDPDSDFAQATITVTCPCDNVSSDSSSAMNQTVGAFMIVLSLFIGLFFVRREEQYNHKR